MVQILYELKKKFYLSHYNKINENKHIHIIFLFNLIYHT